MSSANAPIPRRIARLHLAVIVLVGVALALILLHDEPNEWGGDNVRFLVLADALAGGHGYVDLDLPVPLPHTRYPPLFPVMLVPWVAAGAPLIVIKAFVAALSVAGVCLAWLYLVRVTRPATALLACLATLVCGVFLDAGFSVMSDGPYMLLAFATLLAIDGMWRHERAGRSLWLPAGLLAGLSVLTRTAGASLLPALGVAAVIGVSPLPLRARLARGLAAGLVALGVVGAWHGRELLFPSAGPLATVEDAVAPGAQPDALTELRAIRRQEGITSYAAEFARVSDGSESNRQGISGGGRSLLQRPWLNAQDLWSRAWHSIVPAFVDRAGPDAAWWARRVLMGLLATLGAIAAVGALRGVFVRRSIGDLHAGLYCLMLSFWIGGGPRLLVPVLPLLVLWVAEGMGLAAAALARLGRATDRGALRVRVERMTLVVILLLDLLVTFGTQHMRSRLSGSQDLWWGRFVRMVDRAAEVLPADALIVTLPSALPYQRHHLHAMPLPDVRQNDAQCNMAALLASGADALILSPFLDYYGESRYHRMVEKFPERFELLAADGEVKLLRVVREPPDG